MRAETGARNDVASRTVAASSVEEKRARRDGNDLIASAFKTMDDNCGGGEDKRRRKQSSWDGLRRLKIIREDAVSCTNGELVMKEL